jgi:hypothetical protein
MSPIYQIIGYGDIVLRERLKQLAVQYPRYGYLMLHSLKAESFVCRPIGEWPTLPRAECRR